MPVQITLVLFLLKSYLRLFQNSYNTISKQERPRVPRTRMPFPEDKAKFYRLRSTHFSVTTETVCTKIFKDF